jgi:hypothetical protein
VQIVAMAGLERSSASQIQPRGASMTLHLSTLKKLFLTSVLAVLPFSANSASAQDSAQVLVPFAFVANNYYVPAGHYRVFSSDHALTLVRAESGKQQIILLVRHEDGPAIETRGRMTFQVVGNHHLLSEVRFAGSSVHSELVVKAKRESNVIGKSGQPTSQVELAMK